MGTQAHRWRIPLGVTACGVAAFAITAALAAGVVSARQSQPPIHPALLTGIFWGQLRPAEKQAYLSGFIAGAAAEQARSVAAAEGRAQDSVAVSSHAIAKMRADRTLHFRFAVPVYAAQIDDFYWWENHASVPIVDAMIFFNGEMLKQQTSGRP
jgi:hypothetical protein